MQRGDVVPIDTSSFVEASKAMYRNPVQLARLAPQVTKVTNVVSSFPKAIKFVPPTGTKVPSYYPNEMTVGEDRSYYTQDDMYNQRIH
jgi:hypothetical protein